MDQIARTTKQVAAAVRRVRRQQGLTQGELGKKIKLRQATISRLEKGEEAILLQTLLDVLGALNLELVIRSRTKASPGDIERLF
ncbi:MAG: helix-turn-helix domain-containing protein [Nitrospirae bacterium]|nr:helix-turn-helix domain-containing protein [Nitrospirota bacterium]MBI3351950.1 helix-turn-helix domain-containing protein [Nitrospirota bacterium]